MVVTRAWLDTASYTALIAERRRCLSATGTTVPSLTIRRAELRLERNQGDGCWRSSERCYTISKVVVKHV